MPSIRSAALRGPVARPQVRELVDDRVGPGADDSLQYGVAIQRVGHHRLRTQRSQQRATVDAPSHCGDLVPARDEQRHEGPTDHAGSSGYEDAHRFRAAVSGRLAGVDPVLKGRDPVV